jgi:hypothetical protein
MTLGERAAQFDAHFLWVDTKKCERPSYSWVTYDDLIGHAYQALLPPDHPGKRQGDILFLDVKCGKTLGIGCEVTNRDELVVYYDGYHFFLSRDGL